MIAPQGRIPNPWPMETSETVIPVIGFYSHVPSSSLPLNTTCYEINDPVENENANISIYRYRDLAL